MANNQGIVDRISTVLTKKQNLQLTFFFNVCCNVNDHSFLSFGIVKAKHRNNLISLIFIHLLIFLYPLANKIVHRHHDASQHHEYSENASLCQQEDDCPVCEFEFYNFIVAPQFRPNAPVSVVCTVNSAAPNGKYTRHINYFSLRAPPVSQPRLS